LPPDDRPGPRSHRGARVWLTLDGNVSGIFGDNDGAIRARGRDTQRVPREGAPFSVARPRNHRSGWRAQCTRFSWRARCATSVRRDEVARPSAKSRHRFRGDRHLRRLIMAHPTIEKNAARYTPTKVVVRGARRVVGNSVPPTAARHSPGTRSRAWCRAHARHPLRAWGRARFVPRSRSAFSFAPRASVGVSFPTPSPRSADEDAAPSGGIRPSPGRDGVDPRRDPLPPPRRTARAHRPGGRGGRALRPRAAAPQRHHLRGASARAEQASVRPPRSRRAVPHPDPLSPAHLHPLHPTTAPHPSPSSPGPIAGPPDARTAPVPLLRRLHVSPRRSLRLARHPQSWL